jgi:hypothetical protein
VANTQIIGFTAENNQIQRWPDDQLEAVHDFVQWLFPLPEPSGFNAAVPILTRESIQEFRTRPKLQQKLRVSFLRMMNFYRLEARSGEQITVTRAPKPRRQSGFLPEITIICGSRES